MEQVIYTMTMQTAMANIHYSQTCGAADVDHGAKINISYSSANTTTAMRIRLAAAVMVMETVMELDQIMNAGDLA